jgi:hypothetical protein
MDSELAELSSLASTLDQLAQRIATMGESARNTKREEVAAELFTVERALAGAQRRLARMIERSR